MMLDEKKLEYVDSCMQMLGITLNLLDPNGVTPGIPDEHMFILLMKTAQEDYRKLSDALHALREEKVTP